MQFQGDELFRSRAAILAALITDMQSFIPDVWVEQDGNLRILFDVEAGVLEGLYLANQIALEDMFVQSANIVALRRHGEQFGLEQKLGTNATGTLLFTGDGAITIPIGAEVAFDPGGGQDVLYYLTTQSGIIPNPGLPTAPLSVAGIAAPGAPTVAINATAGNLNGSYIYRVTFYDPAYGETPAGTASSAVAPVNQQVNLSAIPIGPAGVTERHIYRNKGGGVYGLVAVIADNTSTTYTDNATDAVQTAGVAPDLQGNLSGTYEWVISFLTASGETVPGAESIALNLTAQKARLSSIPLGGPGTTRRSIYRSKNGGAYQFVDTINDNSTTTYGDNKTDASLGGPPLAASTAQKISLTAASETFGSDYNAVPGAIRILTDVPQGVTDVTNTTPFIGGSDEEDTEVFRTRLLSYIRSPQSGSKADIEGWAEAIDGVESATSFTNENLGVTQAGHVTVRVSGPGGTVPPQSVLDAVQADINARNLANIAVHVTSFTALPTNVSVTITPLTGFSTADITPTIVTAITEYINSIAVGGTLYISGIIDTVVGLPGVADVVVTTPASNQTTLATQKRTVGTITVS